MCLAAGLLASELAARSLSAVEGRWEVRRFLVDDQEMEQRWRFMHRDGLLGYAPLPGFASVEPQPVTFDDLGLRVHAVPAAMPAVSPLLMVGGGFVMGEGVGDSETLPAHLEALLQREVLNAGVTGYGIDQAVLRGEQIARALAPDVMVLAFTADSARRAEMSIAEGLGKPYFQKAGGTLQLRNVVATPTIEDLGHLDVVRRALSYSRLVDMVARGTGLRSWWLAGQPGRAERVHWNRMPTACLSMERLHQFAQTHGIKVVVMAQYSVDAWRDETTMQEERAVADRVLDCADDARFDTLDTHDAFAAAIRRDGMHHYYDDKYTNDAGNRLMANLVAGHLASRQVLAIKATGDF